MKKWFIPHPFLFAIFPILFLYARNTTLIYFVEIIEPLVISVSSCLVLYLIFTGIFKNRFKGAVVVTGLLWLFFSFGYMIRILTGIQKMTGSWSLSNDEIASVLWILVFASLLIYVIRAKSDMRRLTVFLNLVGIILVSIQLLISGWIMLSQKDTRFPDVAVADITGHTGKLPNIYYIIVDGYGRQDILKEIYDYDNSDFIYFLKSRGFTVGEKSQSNYAQTQLSLTSSLNLDYIQNLCEMDRESRNRGPLRQLLKNNVVFQTLHNYGYSIIAFATGYNLTEMKKADRYIQPGVTVSEFQNVLINMTPLRLIFPKTINLFDIHRNRIIYILERLPGLNKNESPFFVMAHVVAPHPPFVFGDSGQPVQREWNVFDFADGSDYVKIGGTTEEYLRGYKNQINYLNQMLKVAIDSILVNTKDNPPVIILQSDHGPGSGLVWHRDADSTNLKERFSILNAYFLPGVDDSLIFDSINPVNSFRIILNEYFNTDYELLPQRNYFSPVEYPYFYTDVTEKLRQ